MFLPLVISFLPLVLFFIGYITHNPVIIMLGCIVSTALIILLYMFVPSAFTLLKAKLSKQNIILMFRPDKRIIIMPCRLSRGLLWLDKKTPFILRNIEDIYFFEGIPCAVAYSLVGKTLNPEQLVYIDFLEENKITREDVIENRENIPNSFVLNKSNVIPAKEGE